MGKLTGEDRGPLLCELKDGGLQILEHFLLVFRGNPFLELINDIIEHTVVKIILTKKK